MIKWRASAAYRIGFAWSAAFATSVALLGLVVFVAMHLAFLHQLDAIVGDEADTLAAEYHDKGLTELGTAIGELEGSHAPERLLYAVFDGQGRRVLGRLQTSRPPLGTHDIQFVDPAAGPGQARGKAVDLSPDLRLLVAADREWIQRIDDTVILVFAIAFRVVGLMGAGGGVLLGAYLRRRLRSISEGAEAIIEGDRSSRITVGKNGDEFDLVSIALNQMLDRIEILLENLRQVSNDVAHDLRTPLSRLRNFLESHREEPTSDTVENAIGRVDELLGLFTSILRIAEVESGETRRFFQPVDISAMLRDLLETYEPSVRETGRELRWSIEPDVRISGDPQLLAQAVANLLDNAQRHTPEGAVIRTTLASTTEALCIVVADNGVGVPPEDRQRIVRRFERLEHSRSTPGFGLGLNLVGAVAALHGGRLALGDAHPGLEARMELPWGSPATPLREAPSTNA